MRRLILWSSLTALLACAPATVLAASSAEANASAETADDAEADATSDDSEADDSDAIAEQWGRIFAPPGDWRAELSLAAGWAWWDTAYGRVESEGYYRLQGRYLLQRPWVASVGIDYTRRAPAAGPLQFANTNVGLMAGFGPQWWLSRWKLGLDVRGVLLYRRLAISDAADTDLGRARVEPAADLVANAGLSIAGRVALTLEGGVRWRPERLDRLFVISLGWLFDR